MTLRNLTLSIVLVAAGVPLVNAEPPPSRFSLQGQLQAMPPMHGNGRFSLGAQLTPAAPRPSTADRFTRVAKLEPAGKGACTPEPEIFRNGFEAP